jgi:hypothetical protein
MLEGFGAFAGCATPRPSGEGLGVSLGGVGPAGDNPGAEEDEQADVDDEGDNETVAPDASPEWLLANEDGLSAWLKRSLRPHTRVLIGRMLAHNPSMAPGLPIASPMHPSSPAAGFFLGLFP